MFKNRFFNRVMSVIKVHMYIQSVFFLPKSVLFKFKFIVIRICKVYGHNANFSFDF